MMIRNDNGQRARAARGILVALSATLAAIAVQPTALAGGCSASDDDDAQCSYYCDQNDYLLIEVNTHDDVPPYADAAGETSCGGAAASCSGDRRCKGESSSKASRSGSGSCRGRSDELWNSGVSVTCSTRRGTTGGGICIPILNWCLLARLADPAALAPEVQAALPETEAGRATAARMAALQLDPEVGSASVLHIEGGDAVAFALVAGAWVPAEVACEVADGARVCSTGLVAA